MNQRNLTKTLDLKPSFIGVFLARTYLPIALQVSVWVLLSLGVAAAQASPTVDKRADEILRQTSDYLRQTKEFVLETEATYDEVLPSGQKLQFGERIKCYLRRPNKLRAEISGTHQQRLFWFDGKTVNILDHQEKTYTSAKAPAKIDAALDFVMKSFGTTVPIVDVLVENPYQNLIKNVQSGSYLNLATIRGRRCHHLAFTQKTVDWQVWIEDGEKLLPRKLLITYKNVPGQPQYIVHFSRWDLTTRIPEILFSSPLVKEEIREVNFPTPADK